MPHPCSNAAFAIDFSNKRTDENLAALNASALAKTLTYFAWPVEFSKVVKNGDIEKRPPFAWTVGSRSASGPIGGRLRPTPAQTDR
jgi:hypothetical protein